MVYRLLVCNRIDELDHWTDLLLLRLRVFPCEAQDALHLRFHVFYIMPTQVTAAKAQAAVATFVDGAFTPAYVLSLFTADENRQACLVSLPEMSCREEDYGNWSPKWNSNRDEGVHHGAIDESSHVRAEVCSMPRIKEVDCFVVPELVHSTLIPVVPAFRTDLKRQLFPNSPLLPVSDFE